MKYVAEMGSGAIKEVNRRFRGTYRLRLQGQTSRGRYHSESK
jgi:hypothetical protein